MCTLRVPLCHSDLPMPVNVKPTPQRCYSSVPPSASLLYSSMAVLEMLFLKHNLSFFNHSLVELFFSISQCEGFHRHLKYKSSISFIGCFLSCDRWSELTSLYHLRVMSSSLIEREGELCRRDNFSAL